MKKYILLAMGAALGIGANVYVDYLQAQPTLGAVAQEFTLKVTADELNILSEGLQEVPLKKSLPLLNKLRQQVMDQQKPVAPPSVSQAPLEPTASPGSVPKQE